MPAIASAYLLLMRGDQLFLMRRQNTGYEDGNYGVIAGHVEPGETFINAMIREAREEAGIELSPGDLSFTLLMHRYALTSNPRERVDVFFTANASEALQPCNNEPQECGEIGWFNLNTLPSNCIAFIKHAIEQIRLGQRYAEYGWQTQETSECQAR